jgi:hypothetical protein
VISYTTRATTHHHKVVALVGSAAQPEFLWSKLRLLIHVARRPYEPLDGHM